VPYRCDGGIMDQMSVRVCVSNPNSGRYGGAYPDGRFLYLSCFFDFNDDGDWDDVFSCQNPNDAPEHLLIQWVAGAGAASVVNPLPDNVVVIDPSLWGAPGTQSAEFYDLRFFSPPPGQVAEEIKVRIRLEYNDNEWPTPDNKFLGTEFDYSLFGEVEDYIVSNGYVPPGEGDSESVVDFSISQSWPTPFRGETAIQFALPQPSRVRVDVYDAGGRLIAGVIDGKLPAGTHRAGWDGTDSSGEHVPSGVYFIRLEAGKFSETRKVVYIE
jgi:hypothetical protein